MSASPWTLRPSPRLEPPGTMMGTSTQIFTERRATWMPHSVSPALHGVTLSRYWGSSAWRAVAAPPPLRPPVRAGVLGVVGHGQGQVHLPHDEAEEQDRGQHEQQLDAGLPSL